MPSILQGLCNHCGHKTPIMTGGYGAVFVDEPIEGEQHEVAGAVINRDAGRDFATTSDPRFVVLAHPIEELCLAKTGFSWSDLLWQGRYVAVTNVVCRNCGTVFQRRKLTAPPAIGCIGGLAIGTVAGIGFGVWQASFSLAFASFVGGAIMTWLVTDLLAILYVRVRFSHRAAEVAGQRFCPHCQAGQAVAVDGAQSVKCPECHARALNFQCVGRS